MNRPQSLFLSLALAALLLAPTSRAYAESAPAASVRAVAAEDTYRWLFRGDIGIASPVGFGGFTVGHQHLPWLRTEFGVGGSGTGVQLSLMPVFSYARFGGHRLNAGLGVSTGIDPTRSQSNANVFVNVDAVGYEYNGEGGFFFSASGGVTLYVWGNKSFLGSGASEFSVIPQMRLGFGLRF